MGCIPAPACKAVLAQATARWPGRSRASDGICPSAAHTKANPTSDHERGNAVDLTHDPGSGCDAHGWVRSVAARGDERVKYLISAGEIWNPTVAAWSTFAALRAAGHSRWEAARMALPGWRPYAGSNPHRTHAHVSIRDGARDDASSWFVMAPAAPWPWEDYVPKPLDFTSACPCPTGGRWKQTAEGGIHAEEGAPYLGAYNAHPHLHNVPRLFVALVPSPAGGYVQVASSGETYRWDPPPAGS